MKQFFLRRLLGAICLFVAFVVAPGARVQFTHPFSRLFFKCLTLLFIMMASLSGGVALGQTTTAWSGTGSNAPWLTAANWTNGVPTTTGIAQFSLVSSAGNTVGINMNTAGGNQQVGAIEFTSARANPMAFGNSSTTVNGVLTFNGSVLNSVSNVIIRNNSGQTLTLQNTPTGAGTQTMGVALGNATANLVNVDGTGNIVISSNITGAGKNLTFNATNTGDLRLSGTNTYDGGTIVNSTGTGRLRIDATTALPTSGTVRINTAGVMRFNVAGTYGGVGQALEFNPNQIATPALDINFTGNATWQGTVNLLANTRIEPSGPGNSITFSGNMTGAGALAKAATGTLIFSGTGNTLTGGTAIGNGVMTVNSGSSMGTGPLLMSQTSTNNTALNLNNTAQTISSLTSSFAATSGTQTQVITLGTGHTLTINQSTNTTYGTGSVSTLTSTLVGSGNIIKSGIGTLTLTSANGYTGSTTITGGTLALGIANALTSSTNIVLNGGTLSTTGAFNQSVGTINLNANSTIALGTGSHTLSFAASNGVTWAGTTLTVTGWTGIVGTSGTAGKLFVGANASGLTAAQLAKINFTGYPVGAAILSTGEVVPANQPPVAPTLANQTGTVAVPFSYTVPAFTDPESQTLSYAITGLPTGLVADNTTRIISGTPSTTVGSPFSVTVVATDPQSATTAGTFLITINTNQPPVASVVTDQTATVGVAFSYTVPPFTDLENQTLTYTALVALVNGFSFDPATRVVSGSATAPGVTTVTITATDPASNTASNTFTITATPPVPVCGNLNVPGDYPTIQAAVNAACAGVTINVAAGTYTEQVTIGKSLTILGAGLANTIIKAPVGALAAGGPVESGYTKQNIVEIQGTSAVTISGITVKGTIDGTTYGCGTDAFGVYVYDNSKLVLTDAAITDTRLTDPSLFGCQVGFALGIGLSGSPGSATLTNVTISGYQKGGILTRGSGSDLSANHVTVTGVGATTATAQNGVQISGGATGTIENSTITNNNYTPIGNDYTASGVITYNSGVVTISNTSFTGNDVGLDAEGTGTTNVINNSFSGNEFAAIFTDQQMTVNSSGNTFDHRVTNNTTQVGTVYSTIQGAIDNATAGDVLTAAAGTFTEDVTVDKALTINGSNAGIDPNTGSRVAETVILPATSGNDIINLANGLAGVIIDGFTIDGNNPVLTGTTINGSDVDASTGISSFSSIVSNVQIKNNIIQNLADYGIVLDPSNNGGGPATGGHQITHNKIDNVGAGGGLGVLVQNNAYVAITDNVITRVRVGVQTGNYYRAAPGGATPSISNNNISGQRVGIFHNLQYQAATSFTVANNVLSVDPSGVAFGVLPRAGLVLISLGVPTTASSNTVNGGFTSGVEALNDVGDVTLSGGTVQGSTSGILLTNKDIVGNTANAGSKLLVNGVTVISSPVGIRVFDDPTAPAGPNASITITNNTQISGTGTFTAVSIQGSDASANILGNASSFTGTGSGTGIDVNGGTASVNANRITNFYTAINVSNGGQLTGAANNFITANTDGITYAASASTAQGMVMNNDLSGNTGKAILNGLASTTIGATCNWYGTTNVDVQAATLFTGAVNYSPYLNSGTDNDNGTAGFQPVPNSCVSNTPPVATTIANQTATVGLAYSFTVPAFSDTETPTSLTYTASIVPANGLSFDPATRIISGTPSVTGVSSVTVIATDPGSLSGSQTFTITVLPVPCPQSVTNVNTGETFCTIQAAIDAPNTVNSHTISVGVGTYAEAVTVSKSLTLLGANAGVTGFGIRAAESIIDGGGIRTGLFISAPNVVVDGFKFTGGAGTYGAGVAFNGQQSGAQVLNNIFTDNVVGVVEASANAVISHNLFDGNNRSGPAGGSGLYTDVPTNGLMVVDNEFKNHTNNSAVIFGAQAANAHQSLTFLQNYVHDNNADNSMVYSVAVSGGMYSQNRITQPGATALKFAGANSSIMVMNNFLDNNGVGVRIADDGYGYGSDMGITVQNNSLTNTTTFAIDNLESTTVLASCNWYGVTTTAGVAAKVNGPVTYQPFLQSGTDNDGNNNNGFQPIPGACQPTAPLLNPVTLLKCPGEPNASVFVVGCGTNSFSLAITNAVGTTVYSASAVASNDGQTIFSFTTPSQTGIYTYSGYCVDPNNPASISNPTNGTLTVETPPAITLNRISSGTVCAGSAVQLEVQGCSTNPQYFTRVRQSNSGSDLGAPGNSTATSTFIQFAAPNIAGTYTYTALCVNAGSGCETPTGQQLVATLVVQPTPDATLAASSATICIGSSVTLTASGCDVSSGSNYFYRFRGLDGSGSYEPGVLTTRGSNSIVIQPATTGTFSYSVECVNGADGCVGGLGSTSVTVAPIPTATLTVSGSGTLTCAQTSLTLTATGGQTYLFDGPGIVSQDISGSAVVNASGTYSVTVTSAAGCSSMTTTTVFSDTALPMASLAASGTITCASPTVTLTANVTARSGTDTYAFSGPNGPITSTGNTVTVTTGGLYSVTVTSANGCMSMTTTTVFSDTAVTSLTLTSSNNLSCGVTSATLTANIDPAVRINRYTYVFSPGATQISSSNLATITTAGIYSVTATSVGNGCSVSATTTVTSDTAVPGASLVASGPITCASPVVTLSANVTARSGTDTYAFSGPNGPITSTGNTVTVTTGGLYSVTVTSANGCMSMTTTTVTSDTGVTSLTLTSSNNLSCGVTSATLTASPDPAVRSAYNYVFSPGATQIGSTNQATITTAGPYSVTATSVGNGCSVTASTTVTSSTAVPTVTLTNNGPITCASASVTLTAGTNARTDTYVFTGPNGVVASTRNTAVVSMAGTYTVTATSTNGCSSMTTTTVTSNTGIVSLTLTNSNGLSCGVTSATLTANLDPTGARTTYTYAFSNGAAQIGTTNQATVTTAGPYSVTVTAANGCSTSATTTVTSDTAVTSLTLTSSNNLSCGVTSATLTASIDPTVRSAYNYVFSPGATQINANQATITTAGIYSVTATSVSNGCSVSATTTVTSDTAVPGASLVASGTITCGTPVVTLSANVTARSGTDTYAFSGPGGPITSTGNTVTVTTGGLYSVTITSANGCTSMTTTTVFSDTAVTSLTLTSSNDLSCGVTSATLTASPDPAVRSGYTYVFGPGATQINTNQATITMAGVYSVTATSVGNGCSVTATTTVTSSTAAPTVTLTNNGPITCASASVTLTANTGTRTDTYSFSGPNGVIPSTGNTVVVSSAGTYTVTATSINGCMSMTTTTVTSNTGIVSLTLTSSNGLSCGVTSTTLTANLDPTGARTTYTYAFSPGAAQIGTTNQATVTTAGLYSVTVTAANGCSTSATTTVTSDTAVTSLTLTSSNDLSCGVTSATLTASPDPAVRGAYTYVFGPGATQINTNQATITMAGVYSVTATSVGNGCSVTASTTVTASPALTATISGNLAVCSGQSTTLTASGGSSFLWSTGQTTASITAMAGTYSVTVSSGNCSASTSATVTASPALTATISGNLAVCSGQSTTLTASGGSSFLWSTGETTASITAMAGTYSVTVSSGNCSASTSTTVTASPALTATISGNLAVCSGQSTTLTASGGSSFLWSTGQTTASITAMAGTYSVTVSSGNCSASTSTTVTASPALTATISGNLAVCSGQSTTLTASGGSSFLWSTGQTTASITAMAGTYSVTVSSGNCSASTSTTVTASPALTATISGNLAVCSGQSTTLTASGGSTYLWSTGETTASITAMAGTYSVTVSSGNCSASTSATVTASPALTATISGNLAVCSGQSTTLTASGGSTYLWSTGETTASITAMAGTYSVTVSSGNCSASTSATVTASPALTATISGNLAVCSGQSTTLTASGGSSFLWSTGETTASITAMAGAYSVTVSSGNCSASTSATVTASPALTATISGNLAVCSGQSTTLTASGGSSFLWSTGETTASITAMAGAYSVTVSSGNCSASTSATVTASPALTATISGNLAVCSGQSTTLTASGGSTYLWSTGETTASITAMAGTYSVTVSSGNCSASTSATVTASPALTATISGNLAVCSGQSTTLTASGGSTYLWSTGETTASITAMAGTYSVTVSSGNCSASTSATVTASPALTATISGNLAVCSGQSTTLTASGGSSFLWSTGETTASITAMAGAYSVTVSSGNCSASTSATVTASPALTATISGNLAVCSGQSTTLTASGGSSFLWSTGETTASITAMAGAYSVTVSSGNCSASTSATVTASPALTATISGNLAVCSGQSTTLTASGGSTYLWSTGETTASITAMAGTYSVTVSSGNCSASTSATVTASPALTATISGNLAVCSGQSTTLTASGGSSFLWSTGQTTASITAMAGTYSVTVSSGNCSASTSATVTASPALTATISGNLAVCSGQSTTLTASGGSSFLWSTGETTASITAMAGTYSVTVSSGNCSASTSTTVTASPALTATISGNLAVCSGQSTTLTASGGSSFLWSTGQTTASITAMAGTYSVTVSSGNCSASTSTTVTASPALTATISGNLAVCSGQSTTLTASGGSSFLWSTGQTTASITAMAGTYSVTVSSGSCSASTSATVTGVASPTASISGTLTVVSGGSTTLTATGGSSLTWSTGQTTTSISVMAGAYSVTVANASGCTSTTSVTVTSVNTAPTVANAVGPQSATVGVSYTLSLANTFTDAETPNNLTLTVAGLPTSLSLNGSTISGTPSTTVGSPYSVTVTATDPGGLSGSTVFTLSVSPAVSTTTSAPFAITGVTTIDCTPVANRINVTFSPQYAGLNGSPVSFQVLNELAPTTDPGPYSLQLYPDNPVITLRAVQSGVTSTFTYNWLTACNSLSMNPGGNTAPTVANAIPAQSATVGQGFSYVIPANTFTDAQTPNALTLTVTGLPAGLNFTAPATISGTPSMSGVSSVTVTATDSGGLSGSTSFTITVSPAVSTTSSSPFAITGVTTIDCTPVANRVNISFNPQYAGLNGSPVSFQVLNELAPTTDPGPYSLTLYPDNQVITLRAIQGGVTSNFSYNWLTACNSMSMTPGNTAPTVANAVGPQSATVGVGYTLSLANTFTDAQTPNGLVLSATGLPAGLSLTGTTISGTPSMSGVSNVTVTATDPGNLSTSTTFTITVSPASMTGTPTGTFAITGVTTVDCTPVANRINLTFNPQYSGLDGTPVSFQVLNELAPTTNPGPYSLTLYPDNPVLTLRAVQSGVTSTFTYNWLAACNSMSMTPGNTAPTVANPVSPQSATVGVGYTLSLANTFTDAQTPNGLVLSATGLPAGLSLTGTTISGTPSMSGVSNVTVTATDPGNLSTSTTFTITVSPASMTGTPTGAFAITGVTTVSCAVSTPGQRSITFNPQYSGVNGSPISFSVVNELASTTNPGPYTLSLYTDNPIINLRAVQNGVSSSFAYNWFVACNSTSRISAEPVALLHLKVLGNPVRETVEVEVTGAAGGSLKLMLTDAQGRIVGDRSIEQAATTERVRFTVGQLPAGVLLLRATTPGQSQTIRVLKVE